MACRCVLQDCMSFVYMEGDVEGGGRKDPAAQQE
jgi:hypothetical protein